VILSRVILSKISDIFDMAEIFKIYTTLMRTDPAGKSILNLAQTSRLQVSSLCQISMQRWAGIWPQKLSEFEIFEIKLP